MSISIHSGQPMINWMENWMDSSPVKLQNKLNEQIDNCDALRQASHWPGISIQNGQTMIPSINAIYYIASLIPALLSL